MTFWICWLVLSNILSKTLSCCNILCANTFISTMCFNSLKCSHTLCKRTKNCKRVLYSFFTPLSILQLEIKSWLVTGDSLSMELLKTEKGNTTVALSRLRELQNTSASHHKTVRPPKCHSKTAFGFIFLITVTLNLVGIPNSVAGAHSWVSGVVSPIKCPWHVWQVIYILCRFVFTFMYCLTLNVKKEMVPSAKSNHFLESTQEAQSSSSFLLCWA